MKRRCADLTIGLAALFLFGTAALADPRPADRVEASKTFEVEKLVDLPYYEGADADRRKHKLDLYLPRGKKDFPVLFFVHGGAWRVGDKNSVFGLYQRFARFWAQQGVGVVVTNYRLSPGVKHPEHIKDVARAFAWTSRNIGKYHGRVDQIFVCGHSAGGHLVSLLATDETYLKAEGLSLQAIKGAIPMSGVYRIPARNPFFEPIFGDDAQIRKAASPISNVKESSLPFLILCADSDLPFCGKPSSEQFCQALTDKKCHAKLLEIKDRNHVSLVSKVRTPADPVAEAMFQFIQSNCK